MTSQLGFFDSVHLSSVHHSHVSLIFHYLHPQSRTSSNRPGSDQFPKSQFLYSALRFSADISHTGPYKNHGENCGPRFHLSCLPEIHHISYFSWSVCLQAYTGSTTAAIISLFHKVTHLLLTNPYVIVIALDWLGPKQQLKAESG